MNLTAPHKFRLLLGAGAALATIAFAPAADADERYSAIVMDARTNEVLLSEHADEERFPASLTKMMTLYMLFDTIEHGDITLNTRLVASRNASRQPPSRLGLRRGDAITVEQAIRGLVVQSANDVAVVLAERLGGSEARFAGQMNSRARQLGMTDTHFVNPNGLPDVRQHSTAHDLALLSQALWRDFPQYYHYFQTPSFAWRRGSGRNHNHLLGQIEGVDGIKTGYTRASGFNLASSAERNGRRVIVVVMGGESAAARDAQVAYLIEGAFEEYARRDVGGVTLANLPTQRLDVQLSPNAFGPGVMARTSQSLTNGPMSQGALQGSVIETLSPVHAPLDAGAVGQGDQGDNSTDEPDGDSNVEEDDPAQR